MSSNDKILLAHGGGGRLTEQLIREHILPYFSNASVDELGDSARLDMGGSRICFTTDSYVVKPLFFNGGNIGKLAVCGTVNDLAVAGSKPVAISMGLIIEEGLEIETFRTIIRSASEAAKEAGVIIAAGDTKVVEHGSADKLFINTSGVGLCVDGAVLGFGRIKEGDSIIINGTIGDHGMAILAGREALRFESRIQSDCAPLNGIISELYKSPVVLARLKFMRDATRGGLAAVLNEIAKAANISLVIVEKELPIRNDVRAAADMLGFDLLNVANEGKFVAVVDKDVADEAVAIMRKHPLGKDAAIIGQVGQRDDDAIVEMATSIGGSRIVQMPYGRELPRIC